MKYKTLILDFDGTIADTRKSIVQTMQFVAKKMGTDHADEDKIKALIGLPLKATFEKAFNFNEEQTTQAIKIYREHYNTIALDSISLFSGVKETLIKFYDRGITLAVASSKGRDALVKILEKRGIYNLFSFVGGDEDVENKKPAPDLVNLIVDKFGCKKEKCLVVGDTVFDIEMGQRASVATCGVTYGNNTKKQLRNQTPEYIIDNFSDLLDIALKD